ncbi:MAG: hypothetical protein ACOX8L_02250 [Candidatus Methanomethylophilaceae archaeon]|jgi:hypothetical protein
MSFQKGAVWYGDDPIWGKSNLTTKSFNKRLLRLEFLMECIAEELGIDLEELLSIANDSKTQEEARKKLSEKKSD